MQFSTKMIEVYQEVGGTTELSCSRSMMIIDGQLSQGIFEKRNRKADYGDLHLHKPVVSDQAGVQNSRSHLESKKIEAVSG